MFHELLGNKSHERLSGITLTILGGILYNYTSMKNQQRPQQKSSFIWPSNDERFAFTELPPLNISTYTGNIINIYICILFKEIRAHNSHDDDAIEWKMNLTTRAREKIKVYENFCMKRLYVYSKREREKMKYSCSTTRQSFRD